MRVYLINPPAPYLIDDRGQIPMGLMFLHAFLQKHDISVSIVDMTGHAEKDWEIPDDGDIYGITACTPQYPAALRMAEIVKKDTNFVVIGGIHATSLPDRCLGEGKFDAVVMGEGEHTLLSLVRNPRPGKWAWKLEPNIDVFPHPDLDAVDEESYYTFALHSPDIKNQPRGMQIVTSRGCFAKCAFCASKFFWKRRVRYHSVEYMDKWLAYLVGRGYRHLYLVDESFIISKPRAIAMCALLGKYHEINGLLWRTSARADSLTHGVLEAMYSSGCRQVDIGLESGSQRILDLLNKGETVEQISWAIKEAGKIGMDVKASLMVGLPTETEEDVELTVKFIEKHPEIGSVSLATFQPLPGCDIFFNPEKYNFKYEMADWSHWWTVGASEPPLVNRPEEDRERVAKHRQRLIDISGDRYTAKRMVKRDSQWKK